MSEYRAGPNAVIEWLGTWGTIDLRAQYRNFSLNKQTNLLDSTAGTVEWMEFIKGLRQVTASAELLHNGADAPVGGTQIYNQLSDGQFGTLRFSPYGTASGANKLTIPAWISQSDEEYPYDDVAVISIEWQSSGTVSATTW